MNDEKLAEMQKDLADLKFLLHGDPKSPKGGMAQFVEKVGEAVFGDPVQKGGLIADMMQIKRLMWIGIGILLAAQIGVQFLFHIWKP